MNAREAERWPNQLFCRHAEEERAPAKHGRAERFKGSGEEGWRHPQGRRVRAGFLSLSLVPLRKIGANKSASLLMWRTNPLAGGRTAISSFVRLRCRFRLQFRSQVLPRSPRCQPARRHVSDRRSVGEGNCPAGPAPSSADARTWGIPPLPVCSGLSQNLQNHSWTRISRQRRVP